MTATRSLSASASATVSGQIKAWIIGKMDAAVSATIAGTVQVTRGSEVEKVVPARTVLYCDRGSYTYVGTTRKTGSSGLHAIAPSTFHVRAPSAVIWQFRQQAP